MRAALVLIVALTLVATIPAAAPAREHSPEWKLAVIDNGEPPSAHTFAVYARVLDRLQRRCTNPRLRLADFSVTAQRLLRQHHIDWKNIHILRDVAGAIPRTGPRRGCSDIFAAYVAIATAR
jgi:hypothetical protein